MPLIEPARQTSVGTAWVVEFLKRGDEVWRKQHEGRLSMGAAMHVLHVWKRQRTHPLGFWRVRNEHTYQIVVA